MNDCADNDDDDEEEEVMIVTKTKGESYTEVPLIIMQLIHR